VNELSQIFGIFLREMEAKEIEDFFAELQTAIEEDKYERKANGADIPFNFYPIGNFGEQTVIIENESHRNNSLIGSVKFKILGKKL
jgi:hypothetical protein